MENKPDIESKHAQYYQVSALKFCLMVTCTLGLYEIYWAYRNWRYIKERDKSNIYPVWRGIFAPLWYYSLLSDLAVHGDSKYMANGFIKSLLAATYLLLGVAWKLPEPYWIVAFLSFLPILPAVQEIAKINTSEHTYEQGHPHNAWNFSAYLLGGPFVVFIILSAINYIPSAMVTDGSRLWRKDLDYLIEQGFLGEDEKIQYFYSGGLLSIEDDGQFITDGYVVSYGRDPDDGELYGGNVAYEDIVDISVDWSNSPLEDTVVTVTDVDDYEFELWISSESGGDRRFVDEMMSRWKRAKDRNVPEPKQSLPPDQHTAGL